MSSTKLAIAGGVAAAAVAVVLVAARRRRDGSLPRDLCDEYDAWCINQLLPLVDAEEQLCGRVTEAQRQWLQDFCKRWDEIYVD